MKQVITSERIPIKLWLEDLDEEALNQAKNLANLPFAHKHIAIMPDSHVGYGMPIGSILVTKKTVVPNAVGVDIGCGMCALRTEIRELESKDLKKIFSKARKRIPLGFNWHEESQDINLMPKGHEELPIVKNQFAKALKQVGSLGGGNHFIELQKGSDGYVWVMVHSGSRNLGYTVAKHYNETAIKLNELYHSVVNKEIDLAFLPIETPEAKHYIAEMNYCIEFAFANRRLMMKRMIESMTEVKGSFETGELINKPHNFAAWENHYGENVLVHRKGATRAFKDEPGMIPGSQGTHSYIVRGLGNAKSFMSCAHGAGREMGRRQAQRELDLEKEKARLDEKGIVHAIRHTRDLDEAPGAYKDINEVMANQKDLAEIVVQLKPLGVLKG
jgi:tRNA-splicing ligase RtcB